MRVLAAYGLDDTLKLDQERTFVKSIFLLQVVHPDDLDVPKDTIIHDLEITDVRCLGPTQQPPAPFSFPHSTQIPPLGTQYSVHPLGGDYSDSSLSPKDCQSDSNMKLLPRPGPYPISLEPHCHLAQLLCTLPQFLIPEDDTTYACTFLPLPIVSEKHHIYKVWWTRCGALSRQGRVLEWSRGCGQPRMMKSGKFLGGSKREVVARTGGQAGLGGGRGYIIS